MLLFTKLLTEQAKHITLRKKKQGILNEAIAALENNEEIAKDIDNAFELAITNESSRDGILKSLETVTQNLKEKLNDNFKDVINATWLYSQAQILLPGQTIERYEKKLIVGKRRGSEGGFSVSPIESISIDEPLLTDNTDQDIESAIEQNATAQETIEVEGRRLEKNYYPLVQNWARTHGYERCEITGPLLPGPKWENPDLIEIYCEFGRNSNSMNIEVASFEVKLRIDPYAIWQAAHYKKFSTYTFIAFALSEDDVRESDRILDLAISFGLGVLVLDDVNKFKIIHSPVRNNPSNSEIELITSRFAEKFPSFIEQFNNERKKFATHMLHGVTMGINLN